MKFYITSQGQRKINHNSMNEKHIAREVYHTTAQNSNFTRTTIVVQF